MKLIKFVDNEFQFDYNNSSANKVISCGGTFCSFN